MSGPLTPGLAGRPQTGPSKKEGEGRRAKRGRRGEVEGALALGLNQ